MKPGPAIILLALAAGLGAAATPPKGASPAPGASSLAALPPSPLATKMKQVHATLDQVFKARDPNSPLPDLRQNPFRFPGAPATTAQGQAGSTGGRAAQAPENEAARLRRLASSVSFGFLEKTGSAPMVTIGSSSYKEGEMYRITDPVSNTQVLLRIKKIDGKNVTFGLGNSEFTVAK
jgi:hypothetical protein